LRKPLLRQAGALRTPGRRSQAVWGVCHQQNSEKTWVNLGIY
jgi:hypothetical protein